MICLRSSTFFVSVIKKYYSPALRWCQGGSEGPKSARKNSYVRQKPHVTRANCDLTFHISCRLARDLRSPVFAARVKCRSGLRADSGREHHPLTEERPSGLRSKRRTLQRVRPDEQPEHHHNVYVPHHSNPHPQ